MSTFEDAIGPLLKHEGSAYVPEDHGRGASKWGITLATYREYHPDATNDDIAAIGPEPATAFYRTAFWDRNHFELIGDQALATKLLDLSVNMGGATAVKLLQRTIGVPADGILGSRTANAVASHPASVVLAGLRTTAAQYYQDLAQRRPEWAPCLRGWIARLAE